MRDNIQSAIQHAVYTLPDVGFTTGLATGIV